MRCCKLHSKQGMDGGYVVMPGPVARGFDLYSLFGCAIRVSPPRGEIVVLHLVLALCIYQGDTFVGETEASTPLQGSCGSPILE